MKIYYPCDIYDNSTPCVVALGNFDGVHIAHAKLLSAAVEKAHEMNIKSAALIFEQHPDNVLAGACVSPFITSNKEKAERIAALGIDELIFIEFSFDTANLSAEEFVSKILVEKLNAKACVCGFHYRFGSHAQAGVEKLAELCDKYNLISMVMEPVTLNGIIVSSTCIRELIRSGAVDRANEFLGRPYRVEYEVMRGKRLGRRLGFPTINQFFSPSGVIPASGVYITRTKTPEGYFPSVSNVGIRPTVEKTKALNLETHIMGTNENLYGKLIQVEFYKFLRSEMKFTSIDSLIKAVNADIEKVKEYFNNDIKKG